MNPRTARIGGIVALALACLVGGLFGLAARTDAYATPLWPPAGIAIAAVFLYGPWLWPGVLVSATVLAALAGNPLPVALILGAAAVLEALLGAYALRLARFDARLERLRDVITLLAIAIACPAIIALTAATMSALGSSINGARYVELMMRWWSTGLVSIVVVTPFLFAWHARRGRLTEKGAGWLEGVVLVGVVGVLAIWMFARVDDGLGRVVRPYMMFLPLIWAAMRFGPFAATGLGLGIALFGITVITLGSSHGMPWVLQPFFGILSLTGASIAAVVASAVKSERRKAAVLDAALDGIVTIASDGKICEFNHRAELMFGYDEREVIGKDLATTLLPEDLRDDYRVRLERYTGTGSLLKRRSRLRALRKDGSEFPAEVSIVRVPLAGPPMFTGFIHDISTELEAEDYARRAKEHLELQVAQRTADLMRATAVIASQRDQQATAQQLAHVGSFEFEFASGRLAWSDELYRIYGLEPGIVEPRLEDFFGRINPTDRERIMRELRRAISDSGTFTFEDRITRPDGSMRLLLSRGKIVVDHRGRPSRIVGSCQDITDRRRAEEQRSRLAFIVDSSEDAIIGIDLELQIESWNASAEQQFGHSAADVIGRPVSILVPPYAVETERQRFGEIAGGDHLSQYEAVHIRANGECFAATVTSSPIRNAAGDLIGFSKVVRDLSERTKIEAQLRRSLDEKEVLLREIHHRVKNNLQVISSFLRLQLSKLSSIDARRAIADSQSRIQSMALVHQLLYQSKDFASIDFKEYLRSLAERLVTTYRPDGEIEIDVEGSEIGLDVDHAITCGLIVNELLANALVHAFPAGRSGHITIVLGREGADYQVSVVDDGVGIRAPLDLDTVQSFGLKIARTLAEQLGGSLAMATDHGTTAYLVFPVPTVAAHSAAA